MATDASGPAGDVMEGQDEPDDFQARMDGLPEFVAVADLARVLGLSENQTSSYLRRFQKKFPDCRRELEGARQNEVRVMYRAADVLPGLLGLREKKLRKLAKTTDS